MVLSILLLLSPPAADFGPLVVHHHSSQRQHGSAGLLPPLPPAPSPVFDAEERSAMFRLLARLLCPLLERRGRAGDALRAALLRARDGEDASLLLCAASAGADAIVRSLLLLFEREGTRAEVELRDRAGRGALQRACEAGPSREHFEGIGLLLRHGLPLESSWLSRAPFEGHEWLAAVTDLNRLYTGDTNIPGTVGGRYCVRGSTCSKCAALGSGRAAGRDAIGVSVPRCAVGTSSSPSTRSTRATLCSSSSRRGSRGSSRLASSSGSAASSSEARPTPTARAAATRCTPRRGCSSASTSPARAASRRSRTCSSSRRGTARRWWRRKTRSSSGWRSCRGCFAACASCTRRLASERAAAGPRTGPGHARTSSSLA